MKNPLFGLIWLSLFSIGVASCSESNKSSLPSTNDENASEGTFDAFLDLFDQTDSYQSWPAKIMDPIYDNEVYYRSPKDRGKFLSTDFHPIKDAYNRFIPETNIIKKDPQHRNDPQIKFDFWAAKKWKNSRYWLVSIQGFKEHQIDGMFWRYHPLLLVTYSLEGDILDSHVWTYFAYDGIDEIWDNIDVLGDTVVAGYKGQYEYPNLSEIYSKTIITPEGKFKTVYKSR